MGYVLVGYVEDWARVFELEDLAFLTQFAVDLRASTEKL